MAKFLLLLEFTLVWGSASSPPQLRFQSIHRGNQPSTGYMVMQPIFNYSLTEASLRYPAMFVNYTYRATGGRSSIVQIQEIMQTSVDVMADIFRERITPESDVLDVLLVPALTPDETVLGDFARELDILLVSCTTVDRTLADRKRFPSAIHFGPAYTEPYGEAFIALLKQSGWKTVAVINDKLSSSSLAQRSKEQCRAPLTLLDRHKDTISSMEFTVDSSTGSFITVLENAGNYAQVILSCTLSDPQRRLLTDAYDLGMTNGNYIFFHLYCNEVPGDQPFMVHRNDTLDERVQAAALHLLIIRSPPMQWRSFRKARRSILQKRSELFGNLMPPLTLQNNEYEVSCYDALACVTQVMNKTSHVASSGQFIANQMLNRTFNLPQRSMAITAKGTRLIQVEIQQYNPCNDTFKAVFIYDGESKILEQILNSDWTKAAGLAKKSICDVRDRRCDQPLGGASNGLIIGVILGVLVVLGLAIGLIARQGWLNFTPNDKWWELAVELKFLPLFSQSQCRALSYRSTAAQAEHYARSSSSF